MSNVLTYASADTKALCTQDRAAYRALGKPGHRKLERRFKELQAATSEEALRAGTGNWHPIDHDWPGCLGAHLHDGKTILVRRTNTGWHVECVGNCYKH